MISFDPEWLRWGVGTLIAVGGLAIAWLQLRAPQSVPPERRILVETHPDTSERSEIVTLAIRSCDTSELERTSLIIRMIWYRIATSRNADGHAVFIGSKWKPLSTAIDVRPRDTLWFRVAYANVSNRILHDVQVQFHELGFLHKVPCRATYFRNDGKAPRIETHSRYRSIELHASYKREQRVTDALKGARVSHLNRYEQCILDCVVELKTRAHDWRVVPIGDKQYPSVPYSPLPIHEHNDLYAFYDGAMH